MLENVVSYVIVNGDPLFINIYIFKVDISLFYSVDCRTLLPHQCEPYKMSS